MSEICLKNVNINATDEDNSLKDDELKKKMTSFKFKKCLPKIKPSLQGSTMKAFFETESDLKNVKKVISILTDDSSQPESNIEMDQYKESKLSYIEPSWNGKPEGLYKLEVLRSGVILNTLDLASKSYFVVGSSLSCDILMTDETVSEYHAILQYKKVSDTNGEKGIYIYDLNSKHGTFVNGIRVEPNKYIFLQSSFFLSFGNNDKKYLLHTPKDNEEKEADLSAAELQELQKSELIEEQRLKEQTLQKEKEENILKDKEFKGISWGINEDTNANLYALENDNDEENKNEELFVDDPKKALRDWFKWEGYDLEYITEDKGFGYHSCCIVLTLDPVGTTEEVIVNVVGDKMKAIDQCALKACRILNDYGMLKKAHEEKKTLTRNWEEVDYYESDDDNFLDRTGTVEKKRLQRMQFSGKCTSVESNESLFKTHLQIKERITKLENILAIKKVENNSEDSDEDALEVFMSQLETSTLTKTNILNIKIELENLYKNREQILRTMNSKGLSSNVQLTSDSKMLTDNKQLLQNQ